MKIKLKILIFLFCAVFLCFSLEAKAQKSKPSLTIKDKSEIIKTLLEEVFGNNPGKTIYISTKNIPAEIQTCLPRIKNVKFEFISASRDAAAAAVCPYQIDEFTLYGKNVSIGFGDCNQGLSYDFRKIRGRWKIVPQIFQK